MPARTFNFTDQTVRSLPIPPKPQQLDYFDTKERGLGVRVSYGGRRSFFVMYSVGKKRQRTSLGEYGRIEDGRLSLKVAREKAKAALGGVVEGADPAGEARAARRAATVEMIAADWIEARKKSERSKSWVHQEHRLKREVLPVIGPIRGRDLEGEDIVQLLQEITDRPAPILANRVHEILNTMFRWAVKKPKYLLTANVAEAWERNPKNQRDRFLSLDELKAYWQALDHDSVGDGPAGALRLCLLTGQRQQNILGMRRDQLFLQDRVWRVPASTTKTGVVHKVPLSNKAIDIIESRLADMEPEQQWVFEKRGGEGSAGLTFLSKPHRRACKQAGIADYKPHDHRHTFATHCDIMGVPRLVWDGILGHSIASMAELYSGHDFADERLNCVKLWADRIEAALADNVVEMPSTKKRA